MGSGRRNSFFVCALLFCFCTQRGFVESGVDPRRPASDADSSRAASTSNSKLSDDEKLEAAAKDYEMMIRKGIEAAAKNKTAWQEHLKNFTGYDDQRMHAAGGFNCSVFGPSPSVPTSVHRLRPGDIKVIGAMGDSLTAGFGMLAGTPLQMLTEWRGRSWSIGGDESVETVVTLPNLFRRYNPNLIGFSEGKARVNSVNKPGAHLDVAVSGAKAELMMPQANKLIDRIRSNPKIDFEKDWKLVTIFIGANDLCAYNKDKIYYSEQRYYEYLEAALETLKTMPRTFVNLVEVLEATMVKELGPNNLICREFHKIECPDFMNDKNKIEAGKIVRIKYQKMVEALAAKYADMDKEDFTVVHQPFFKDTVPPLHTKGWLKGKADLSFFAPDCFHFSAKADAAAAEGLWNNIFEREHQKRTSWRVGEKLVCPTEADPYLKTVKNSNFYDRNKGSSDGNGWNEARGDFEEYPTNTGSATTWSFIGVLVGIAVIACILYYVKTRKDRQRDSERSGLLNLDDEDTIYDDRIGRSSSRPSTTSSNEVPMQQMQGQPA